MSEVEQIWVTATGVHSWAGPPGSCGCCGAKVSPVRARDEEGAGKTINHWVSLCATGRFPSREDLCSGCTGLFMAAPHGTSLREAAVDLRALEGVVRQVAARSHHQAVNPQESEYPSLAVKHMDFSIDRAAELATAQVVDPEVFFKECYRC